MPPFPGTLAQSGAAEPSRKQAPYETISMLDARDPSFLNHLASKRGQLGASLSRQEVGRSFSGKSDQPKKKVLKILTLELSQLNSPLRSHYSEGHIDRTHPHPLLRASKHCLVPSFQNEPTSSARRD